MPPPPPPLSLRSVVATLLPCCLRPSASTTAATVPLRCCRLPCSAPNFVVMPPLPPPCRRQRAAVATPLLRWCCHSAANTALLPPRCRHCSAAGAKTLRPLTPPYCRRAAAAPLPPPLRCRRRPRADTAVAMLPPPPPLCCSRCRQCLFALPPRSLLPLSCRCAPTNNALLPPRCRRRPRVPDAAAALPAVAAPLWPCCRCSASAATVLPLLTQPICLLAGNVGFSNVEKMVESTDTCVSARHVADMSADMSVTRPKTVSAKVLTMSSRHVAYGYVGNMSAL
jgi:hypothetical protein